MYVSAIIAAAGRGERFGAGLKQLVEIDGRAILDRSVQAYLTHPSVGEVIVALPEGLLADPPAYLRDASKPLHLVARGARPPGSGANAFGAIAAATDVVVVHDAARPFASEDLIERTIVAAARFGAALAA